MAFSATTIAILEGPFISTFGVGPLPWSPPRVSSSPEQSSSSLNFSYDVEKGFSWLRHHRLDATLT